MKKDLSALEIRYLVREFQTLIDSKVDKIYQPEKKIVLLQLHKPGEGKKLVRITPDFMYITAHKEEMPERPPGFSVFLRKYLDNARIRAITQYNSERVVDIMFEKKEKYHMIIELFGGGNVILCDVDYKIINPLERQKWKDRTVKKGEQYELPGSENRFGVSSREFEEIIKKSKKKNVSTTLAMEFNLGGEYAKESCNLAKVDPENKKADEKKIKRLYKEFKKMLDSKLSPIIVYEKSAAKDILPYKLSKYKDFETKRFDTFNSALDSVLSEGIVKAEKKDVKKRFKSKISKTEKMMQIQKKSVEKLEKNAELNQKKGELIYENYQELKHMLKDLKKAREKLSWKEIKQKLKGHKKIKKINEKTGEITVDL